jgi:hypothetical protein
VSQLARRTTVAAAPPGEDPEPEESSMDMEANGQPDSEAIRRLEEEHRHYSEKLEELLQKPWLSEDEQIEEVRLKKLKLHIKDQLTIVRGQIRVFTAA